MKPWIKWTAIVIGAVIVLLAATIAAGLQMFDRKKSRKVDVAVAAVPYTTDAKALERGKYLFESRGCVDCHGANGAGRDFVNRPEIHLRGANITPAGVV